MLPSPLLIDGELIRLCQERAMVMENRDYSSEYANHEGLLGSIWSNLAAEHFKPHLEHGAQLQCENRLRYIVNLLN